MEFKESKLWTENLSFEECFFQPKEHKEATAEDVLKDDADRKEGKKHKKGKKHKSENKTKADKEKKAAPKEDREVQNPGQTGQTSSSGVSVGPTLWGNVQGNSESYFITEDPKEKTGGIRLVGRDSWDAFRPIPTETETDSEAKNSTSPEDNVKPPRMYRNVEGGGRYTAESIGYDDRPLPLERPTFPPFPVSALPKAVGEYVEALAENTQTPVDMAACAALTILSMCCQGSFKIEVKPGWKEPLNLFSMVVMAPSERKSPVLRALLAPVFDFEKDVNESRKKTIVRENNKRKVLEYKIDRLSKKDDPKSAEELEQASMELAMLPETHLLQLVADNVTPEKLTSILQDNNGRAAVISAEAGVLDILGGAYSGKTNIDTFLKGYSGDSIRVDRISRESEVIDDPALTVLLMTQPSVLSGMMRNGTFSGRGLTARFLYSIPTSFVGKRAFYTKAIPDETEAKYKLVVMDILTDALDRKEPEMIRISPRATELFRIFVEWLEPQLGKGGALNDIAEWAGKLAGNTARIAAVITRAERILFLEQTKNKDQIRKEFVVSGETMAAAIEIGKYMIEHARGAFALFSEGAMVKRAQACLEVIIGMKSEHFTCRDVMRSSAKFRSSSGEVQELLAYLERLGYVVELPSNDKNARGGRKPNPIYALNPETREVIPDMSALDKAFEDDTDRFMNSRLMIKD